MGVKREGFVQSQRAPIQALVHLAQLLCTALHADVDDIRDVEFLNPAQLDIERGETAHDPAGLFNDGLRSHWQRPRRKHADMRVRIAAGHQLQPQIVQKAAQRFRKVDHERVEAQRMRAIGF